VSTRGTGADKRPLKMDAERNRGSSVGLFVRDPCANAIERALQFVRRNRERCRAESGDAVISEEPAEFIKFGGIGPHDIDTEGTMEMKVDNS